MSESRHYVSLWSVLWCWWLDGRNDILALKKTVAHFHMAYTGINEQRYEQERTSSL